MGFGWHIHHLCLRPLGIIFQLTAISEELLKMFRSLRCQVKTYERLRIEPAMGLQAAV